jgi:formylglycine-generating enzyme required for sulfatase activity
MHQETLLYMWHRLPYEQKHLPSRSALRLEDGGRRPTLAVRSPRATARPRRSRFAAEAGRSEDGGRFQGNATVPAGVATLGATRGDVAFGWDNEFGAHDVHVPEFDVDVLPVTNAEFLDFMNEGGYSRRQLWSEEGWSWIQEDRVQHPAFWLPASPPTSNLVGRRPPTSDPRPPQWQWRGMFRPLALPLDWPVYVSHAEASAYARWKGRRLMTEPEFHRAAEGSTTGHFDFAGFDPIPPGSHPPSAAGVYDLVGNGWEWTSTVFAPFDGFVPMRSYPEYSADFFDGRHYVMKGASSATAKELVRPSFRNWFRGNYPYVYAKFRTAK